MNAISVCRLRKTASPSKDGFIKQHSVKLMRRDSKKQYVKEDKCEEGEIQNVISGVYSGMEKMNLTHKLAREIREG